MDLSIVIPAYNYADGLIRLSESLLLPLTNMSISFEVIIVDDGSSDKSFEVIKTIHCQDNRIKGISLKRNLGQHTAILIGLQHASGRYVLLMDDDEGSAIQFLPYFWQKAEDGCDVISGQRIDQIDTNFGRKLTRKLISLAISVVTRQRFNDATSSYKLFSRDLIEDLLQNGKGVVCIQEYVMMKGKMIEELPLPECRQVESTSRYTLGKLMETTLMLVGSFVSAIVGPQMTPFFKNKRRRAIDNVKSSIGLLVQTIDKGKSLSGDSYKSKKIP